ncbi:hypothetical protein CHL67_01595 [Prosthecochloris sp. GSB1]|uniref:hypothetical protein n=1 Tax=Prosthecochloris sp. GSB1 TaxID=281093 RepID=UPI000B8CEC8C|nr:hypothetical protein [Prosthecochloris sp. GSB1]ASQ89787.1 hypothetical protein CHL67_01595 [Prosthecochloris sp. GSB1]
MNKILIVGHQNSGYRDVEHILLDCGMKPARKSKNQGLSTIEIGLTLRRAHGCGELDGHRDIQQIDAGPVWNGLALDLLMNNIDQKFWGWSDPDAIYLLDYWKSLDPKMAFLLVYDEPHRVLREIGCDEARFCTRETVEARLESWSIYNRALLAFYLRNQSRSMLVNARQVRQNADAYLKQLQSYLDDHVRLSGPVFSNGAFKSIFSQKGSGGTIGQEGHALSATALSFSALADGFLVESILSEYPEYQQCYEELQASATIPQEVVDTSGAKAFEAWLIQMKRYSETGRAIAILTEKKQRVENELIELQVERKNLNAELSNSNNIKKELTEENGVLLVQLHQVQEELELYRFESRENQRLGEEKALLEKSRQALAEEKQGLEKKLKELQRQQDFLQQESKSASEARNALTEENGVLLVQLHQVQEELELYRFESRENQRLGEEKALLEKSRQALAEEKQGLEKKLKELQRQQDFLQQESKSASEARNALTEENGVLLAQLHQVQEELELYRFESRENQRLGEEKALLEKSRQALAEEKQGLEKKLKELQRQQDFLQQESKSASEARNALTEENGVLLAQLHQVQEELELYHFENRKLRQRLSPDYYGAADRLKKELPYQLGAVIIERTRKIWPVLFLPVSLSRIVQTYRKQEKKSEEKLPPLTEYRDYHEAEKAQKHLSYRLGQVWLRHSRKPWGWFVMPFALAKAHRAYRDYRQSI